MPKFYCRPDTWDEAIVREVYLRNEYGIGTFTLADTILDIGAHVGSFSVLAAERGAGRVLAFEPHLQNAQIAMRNCSAYRVVEMYPLGIWRSDEALLQVFSHCGYPTGNTGGGSIADPSHHDLKVATIALDSVLGMLDTVRLLKIDCEGSEWSILYTSQRLNQITEIVGEYHENAHWLRKDTDPASNITTLADFLNQHGFTTSWRSTAPQMGYFRAVRTFESIIV